jgi:hypothetical protein
MYPDHCPLPRRVGEHLPPVRELWPCLELAGGDQTLLGFRERKGSLWLGLFDGPFDASILHLESGFFLRAFPLDRYRCYPCHVSCSNQDAMGGFRQAADTANSVLSLCSSVCSRS